MDGSAPALQSADMSAKTAVPASEHNLQMITDTIAELTCQPVPTNSPSSSTAHPVEQQPTGESHVATGLSVQAPANGSLRDASINRLACLFRH
jgi:hypothetical protein